MSLSLICYFLLLGTIFVRSESSSGGHHRHSPNGYPHPADVLSLAGPILPSSSEESANFSPEFDVSESSDLSEQITSTYNSSCPAYRPFYPIFDGQKTFQTLGFHDTWVRQKWFWQAEDFSFESRYAREFQFRHPPREITVFIVPHSHSDPGWLKTFEGYFYSNTKHTLDLAVEKLTLYPNMTFVWNEISFLNKWWQHAKINQKVQFLQLIREGRLEILTGGWVMADEATVNLYSMIDELVEGRQWVRNYLGIAPNVSWSIDPFGHTSTMPYLLKSANIHHMVIQRLHYAWKKYLGENEFGNFRWVQRWDNEGSQGILCHNAPFDLYTTKHTCGPNPNVCLKFDFRNIMGEYSEYMRHSRPVRDSDVGQLATELVGQFQRTASLSPSNVVMFPLGDDFRFDKSQEWDQQYENYIPLINYINQNYGKFRVRIRFGTVSDYFKALDEENNSLPTFSGDFFPYSDVYVSGRPAYWTGFYGTRPYWKKFYRETESNMRSAEILFSYARNLAITNRDPVHSVILDREYQNLIIARRNLALFAHHDGSTGTSRKTTMDDYGRKLLESMRSSLQIQRQSLRAILYNAGNVTVSSLGIDVQTLTFGDMPTKVPRVIYESNTIVKKVVLFNSLSFKRFQLIKVRVTSPYVKVLDTEKQPIVSQISPVMELLDGELFVGNVYELSFLAELDPLTIHTFEIRRVGIHDRDLHLATVARVSCRGCTTSQENSANYKLFEIGSVDNPTIVIGNGEQELYINSSSGYIRRVTHLKDEVSLPVKVRFGAYKSIFRESGAYLLKPDLSSPPTSIPFEEDKESKIVVVEGRVTSYVTSWNDPIEMTTRVLKTPGMGIHIENIVNLGTTPGEVYMRVDTWLNSTTVSPYGVRQPTLFTDQNGYTMEKRVKVPWIDYQGNNYPVNTMTYLQDADNLIRFSMLVDRTHGFSSMEQGRLETLIERRTLYDDGRGMSEGVTDNKRTISNYIILLERLDDTSNNQAIQPDNPRHYGNNLPTLNAHHLSLSLNYPANSFGYDDTIKGSSLSKHPLLTQPLPKDSHLINLRTMSNLSVPLEDERASEKSLMIVQKLGYLEAGSKDCYVNSTGFSDLFEMGTRFNGLRLDRVDLSDLAGIFLYANGDHRRSTLPIAERQGFEITSYVLKFKV